MGGRRLAPPAGLEPAAKRLEGAWRDHRHIPSAFDRGAGDTDRLKPHARGIRLDMLALIAYRSYHGATTVWAFVVAILIVLVAGWYIRHRR
ncbi:hypothetical protein GCM10017668_23920 [Streptomyces tuirus]|uniref:Uncharacterized protein n=1 Tax=Streptomyces tuirus TaxID=68278 RepID=A0A7G1NCK5_9ACTN|nr:hypothetical protein GCM10017668_23920 [Streptomyces tuirus]